MNATKSTIVVRHTRNKRVWPSRMIQEGRCPHCGNMASGYLCDDCREEDKIAHRRNRASRSIAGLCIDCGKASAPNRVRCSPCLERAAALQRERRMRSHTPAI